MRIKYSQAGNGGGFRSRLSKWISRARISRCLVLSLNYGRSGGRSEEVGSNRYESKWPRIGSMNSRNGSIRALPFAHRFPRELGFMLAATMTHPRMRPDLITATALHKRTSRNYHSLVTFYPRNLSFFFFSPFLFFYFFSYEAALYNLRKIKICSSIGRIYFFLEFAWLFKVT